MQEICKTRLVSTTSQQEKEALHRELVDSQKEMIEILKRKK